jgi:hypothetical protein
MCMLAANHLPEGREGGPAKLVGERLHQTGEGRYLQRLVDVDDAGFGLTARPGGSGATVS